MKNLYVAQSINITATPENVWAALTNRELTNYWITEFSKYSKLDSTWEAGSPVYWFDMQNNVELHGRVIQMIPQKMLRYTVGDVQKPEPVIQNDFDGIFYYLSSQNGITTLTWKQGDFALIENGEMYMRYTEKAVEKILQKVKTVAENLEKLEQEGYTHIRVCPLPPNQDLPEHTHDIASVHIILDGELMIEDHTGSYDYISGDRVDFSAGTTHKARGKTDTGLMIVAEKL